MSQHKKGRNVLEKLNYGNYRELLYYLTWQVIYQDYYLKNYSEVIRKQKYQPTDSSKKLLKIEHVGKKNKEDFEV